MKKREREREHEQKALSKLTSFSHQKKTKKDHYPERSLTTFIFGAPSAFAAIVQLLLSLVSPSSRGKIKFVKAGSDWATAGVADASVADPASPGRVVIDGAALPRVLGARATTRCPCRSRRGPWGC